MIYNVIMKRHSDNIKKQIQHLRSLGKTFTEINSILKTNFPKAIIDTGGYHVPLIATDTQQLHPSTDKK